jgi:prolyl-tRNA synthetase
VVVAARGLARHQKATQIIREEQDAIGAQEMIMPVLGPAEIWKRSGRYDIDEIFKLDDRKGAPHVLAITHEEIVTTHVAAALRSYRQLPMMLYHFQTKGRDEARPRAGVLRTREFIMKDAYSFDRDAEGMQASYDLQAQAYRRTFERTGLEFYEVESDVGMMGGSGAHEYMAPCAAGENEVALAPGLRGQRRGGQRRRAAGRRADARARRPPHPGRHDDRAGRRRPRRSRIALPEGVPRGHRVARPGQRLRARRPPHQRGQAAQRAARGLPARRGRRAQGPRRVPRPARRRGVGVRPAVEPGLYVVGANEPDLHRVAEVPAGERLDVRSVENGDTVGGAKIHVEPAIEVGNIFKLGTRYSDPLGATYLDENGKEQLVWMGSYGIGPARIAAAAVEQFADEQGISWPRALAPYDVHVVGVGKPGTDEARVAEDLYGQLKTIGLDVLLDDRSDGAGAKFKDAELLGCPIRLTVGKRAIEAGAAEAMRRRGQEQLDPVPLDAPVEAVRDLWHASP